MQTVIFKIEVSLKITRGKLDSFPENNNNIFLKRCCAPGGRGPRIPDPDVTWLKLLVSLRAGKLLVRNPGGSDCV